MGLGKSGQHWDAAELLVKLRQDPVGKGIMVDVNCGVERNEVEDLCGVVIHVRG